MLKRAYSLRSFFIVVSFAVAAAISAYQQVRIERLSSELHLATRKLQSRYGIENHSVNCSAEKRLSAPNAAVILFEVTSSQVHHVIMESRQGAVKSSPIRYPFTEAESLFSSMVTVVLMKDSTGSLNVFTSCNGEAISFELKEFDQSIESAFTFEGWTASFSEDPLEFFLLRSKHGVECRLYVAPSHPIEQ